MEAELLRKEREYRKINEDLETKTRELLRQVDSATVHFSKRFIKFSQKTQNDDAKIDDGSTRYPVGNEFSSDWPPRCKTQFKDVTHTDVSESTSSGANEMGVKGATHFFRARVKHLERDNGKLHVDFKSKVGEIPVNYSGPDYCICSARS